MTFLLVGEAPNPATVGRPHLWLRPDDSGIRHTANRLRDLAGWTTAEYLTVFSCRDNVVSLNLKKWNHAVQAIARQRAKNMLRMVCQTPTVRGVVCLGKHAAEAFGLDDVVPLQFDRVRVDGVLGADPVRVAYLPHTSGLNRWWNDPFNLCTGQAFLRSLRDEVYSPA